MHKIDKGIWACKELIQMEYLQARVGALHEFRPEIGGDDERSEVWKGDLQQGHVVDLGIFDLQFYDKGKV